jgi:hypothetical protein
MARDIKVTLIFLLIFCWDIISFFLVSFKSVKIDKWTPFGELTHER